MKYKITNRIFSPLQLEIGIIPARGSIIVNGSNISKGIKLLEKSGEISIKEYKEK